MQLRTVCGLQSCMLAAGFSFCVGVKFQTVSIKQKIYDTCQPLWRSLAADLPLLAEPGVRFLSSLKTRREIPEEDLREPGGGNDKVKEVTRHPHRHSTAKLIEEHSTEYGVLCPIASRGFNFSSERQR